MDPMLGPNREVRKHAHKHFNKSSSKLKKGDVPSMNSSHREAEMHKHDKKMRKPAVLPVQGTKPCTLPTSASLKTSDLSVLGKFSTLALVPALARLPLTPGRLEKLPEPHKLLPWENRDQRLPLPSASREVISPTQDIRQSGHASPHPRMVYMLPPALTVPWLELESEFSSSEDLDGAQGLLILYHHCEYPERPSTLWQSPSLQPQRSPWFPCPGPSAAPVLLALWGILAPIPKT